MKALSFKDPWGYLVAAGLKDVEKCRWYSEAKPGGRKCYFGEPQCWRGWLDMVWQVIKLRLSK